MNFFTFNKTFQLGTRLNDHRKREAIRHSRSTGQFPEQKDGVAMKFVLGVTTEHNVPGSSIWLGNLIKQFSCMVYSSESCTRCDETWRNEMVVLKSMDNYLGLNPVEMLAGIT